MVQITETHLHHGATIGDGVRVVTSDQATMAEWQEMRSEQLHDKTKPEHYALLHSLYTAQEDAKPETDRPFSVRDSNAQKIFQLYLQSQSFSASYARTASDILSRKNPLLSKSILERKLAGRVFADIAQNFLIHGHLPEEDVLLNKDQVLALSQQVFPESVVVEEPFEGKHLFDPNHKKRSYTPDVVSLRKVNGDPHIANVYEFSSAQSGNGKYTRQYETFLQMLQDYPSLFLPDTQFVLFIPLLTEIDNVEPLMGSTSVGRVHVPVNRVDLGEFTRYLFRGFQEHEGSKSAKGKRIRYSGSATLSDIVNERVVQDTLDVNLIFDERVAQDSLHLVRELPFEHKSLESSLRGMGIFFPRSAGKK